MKRALNVVLATAVLSTQAWATPSLEQLQNKIEKKITESGISFGASVLSLDFNPSDLLGFGTGVKYEYKLDPETGKYLRQDKWTDYIRGRLGAGFVNEGQISRDMAYGRYYDASNVSGLKKVLFSPDKMRDINSETLAGMEPGDMASITLSKATFLGLSFADSINTVGVRARTGQAYIGKITVKILRNKNNSVTVSFAKADESSYNVSGDVRINIIPGLLRLKVLKYNNDSDLKGHAELSSYNYDLSNPQAKEVLNKVLKALEGPSILDSNLAQKELNLTSDMSAGLIDVISSDEASEIAGSGVVPSQKVSNSIADGIKQSGGFTLIPGLFSGKSNKHQTTNVVDIKLLTGSTITNGQYIIGYRADMVNKNQTINSIVYKPDPNLTDVSQAKGYRGLSDLVGISYHTQAKTPENAKELLTYVKLCNANILSCKPISSKVVDPSSSEAKDAKNKSSINSNYFFSKSFFEKMKDNMNWANLNNAQKQEVIAQRLTPTVRDFLVAGTKDFKYISRLKSFFTDILDNNCYSNLVGIEAKSCFTELHELYMNDENIRLNMPSLLIAMYDPSILSGGSDAARSELSTSFATSINTNYKTKNEVVLPESKVFAMDGGRSASQIGQFSSLIDTWQRQIENELSFTDKVQMKSQLD